METPAPIVYVNTYNIDEPGWPMRRAEVVMHPLTLQDGENCAAEFRNFLLDNPQKQRFLSHAYANDILTSREGMMTLAQTPNTLVWGVSEIVRTDHASESLTDEQVRELVDSRRLGNMSLGLSGSALAVGLTPEGPHEVRQALFRTGRGIGTAVHLGRFACIFGRNHLYVTARVFPGNVASESALARGFVERPIKDVVPVMLYARGPDGEEQFGTPHHYVALDPNQPEEAQAAFLSADQVLPPTDPTQEFLRTLATSALTGRQMQRASQAVRITAVM